MAPQSLQSLDREKFKKLLELAGTENKLKYNIETKERGIYMCKVLMQ